MARQQGLSAAALVAALLVTSAAPALAPCDHVCHLAQGQPLLLADSREAWVRRCVTLAAKERCVAQRITLSGVIREERPAPSLFEAAFRALLQPHKVVSVTHRFAWVSPQTPLPVGPTLSSADVMTRLEGLDVVLHTDGAPEARRKLSCIPVSAVVYRLEGDSVGALVVVGHCVTGRGSQETIAVFESAGRTPP